MRKKREEVFTTIKDVADDAQVSIATVSRVINEGRVSERRKKRVLESIKKLNYVPNNSARNLASVRTTKRISLIIPTIEHSCYTQLIKGFKQGSALYKYDAHIQDYDFDKNEYKSLTQRISLSSEIRAVVSIGDKVELNNKVLLKLDSKYFKYEVSKDLKDSNCGIFFDEDKHLAKFFKTKITKKGKVLTRDTITNDYDFYITQTIEQAAYLINNGVKGKIYCLENSPEITKKLKQVSYLKFDFYTLGIVLSRILIKSLQEKIEDDDKVTIVVGG